MEKQQKTRFLFLTKYIFEFNGANRDDVGRSHNYNNQSCHSIKVVTSQYHEYIIITKSMLDSQVPIVDMSKETFFNSFKARDDDIFHFTMSG